MPAKSRAFGWLGILAGGRQVAVSTPVLNEVGRALQGLAFSLTFPTWNSTVLMPYSKIYMGLPWQLSGKESACQCRRLGFDLWVRKIPWTKKWQPTPVFLSGKSHSQGSLVGYIQSMGSQRVRHNLVTEQQQRKYNIEFTTVTILCTTLWH